MEYAYLSAFFIALLSHFGGVDVDSNDFAHPQEFDVDGDCAAYTYVHSDNLKYRFVVQARESGEHRFDPQCYSNDIIDAALNSTANSTNQTATDSRPIFERGFTALLTHFGGVEFNQSNFAYPRDFDTGSECFGYTYIHNESLEYRFLGYPIEDGDVNFDFDCLYNYNDIADFGPVARDEIGSYSMYAGTNSSDVDFYLIRSFRDAEDISEVLNARNITEVLNNLSFSAGSNFSNHSKRSYHHTGNGNELFQRDSFLDITDGDELIEYYLWDAHASHAFDSQENFDEYVNGFNESAFYFHSFMLSAELQNAYSFSGDCQNYNSQLARTKELFDLSHDGSMTFNENAPQIIFMDGLVDRIYAEC